MTQIKNLTQRPLIPDVRVSEHAEQCCVQTFPSGTLHQLSNRRRNYSKARPEWDPERCQRQVAVEIDGKRYCKIHAGQEALRILIRQQENKSQSQIDPS